MLHQTIRTLRKARGFSSRNSLPGCMWSARLCPSGKPGYHLDKDTTPIPR